MEELSEKPWKCLALVKTNYPGHHYVEEMKQVEFGK
jgi:hypothetical protein